MIENLDQWLEILDNRIVRTKAGPYVSVEDLKKLNEEFKEAKAAEDPGKFKPGTTLNQVSRALLKDPEFLAQFEPPEVRAPADAGVVKPVREEETVNEAA